MTQPLVAPIAGEEQAIELQPFRELPPWIAFTDFGTFTLLGTVALSLVFKSLRTVLRRGSFLRKTLDDSLLIHAVLGQIIQMSNADRVLLLEFHNGESFTNGRHFVKLTATAEVTKENITAFSGMIQAVPISHYAIALSELQQKGAFCTTPLEKNDNQEMEFYAFGVARRCMYLLTYGEDPLGILDLHYCWNSKVNPLTAAKIKPFKNQLVYLMHRKASLAQIFNQLVESFFRR